MKVYVNNIERNSLSVYSTQVEIFILNYKIERKK